jgi:hypothetical protein
VSACRAIALVYDGAIIFETEYGVVLFCLCVDVNSVNDGMKWVNNRNKKLFFVEEANYLNFYSCF